MSATLTFRYDSPAVDGPRELRFGPAAPPGPNLISDDTTLGTLTDAVADALALLATNAAGTAARKVAITSIVRAILQATDAAGVRAAIGLGTLATQSGTFSGTHSGTSSGTNTGDQDLSGYALTSAVPGLAPVQSVAGRTGVVAVAAADVTDSTATGRAVLTAASQAAARSAIGAGTGSGDAITSGTLGQFAATTSAQLAGVLSDETGYSAGAVVVYSISPTLTTPTVSGTLTVQQSGGSATVTTAHDGTRGTQKSTVGLLRLLDANDYGIDVGKNGTLVQLTATGTGMTGFQIGNAASQTVYCGFWHSNPGTGAWQTTAGSYPLGWPNSAAFFRPLSSGVIGIDNGTAGTYRDLILRNLTTSGGTITADSTAATGVSVSGNATQRYMQFARSGMTSYVAANNDLNNFRSLWIQCDPGAVPSAGVVGINGQIWFVNSSATLQGLYGVAAPSGAILNDSVAGDMCFRTETSGGAVRFGVGAAGTFLTATSSKLTTTGVISVGVYTVATLPSAASNAGAFAQVTDANSTTNGTTVAGGGSNRVPVFSNGTNWIVK